MEGLSVVMGLREVEVFEVCGVDRSISASAGSYKNRADHYLLGYSGVTPQYVVRIRPELVNVVLGVVRKATRNSVVFDLVAEDTREVWRSICQHTPRLISITSRPRGSAHLAAGPAELASPSERTLLRRSGENRTAVREEANPEGGTAQ
jgi:hypothetical protein